MPTPDAQTPLTDAAVAMADVRFRHYDAKLINLCRDLEKRLAAATADKEKAELLLHDIANTTAIYTDGGLPLGVFTFDEARRIFAYLKGDGADRLRALLEESAAARSAQPQTQGREEG